VDGDGLALEYRDDGPGYPQDVGRPGGTGIGLSLVGAILAGTLRGPLSLSTDAGAVATIRIDAEEPNRT
jgi:two-component sensor histidine kinase